MSDLHTARALLANEEPARWLFTGDSITHGTAHTNGERDHVQLFEERIRWELQRTRDHVICMSDTRADLSRVVVAVDRGAGRSASGNCPVTSMSTSTAVVGS